MNATNMANSGHTGDWFVTTHWSVVLAAREKGSPESAAALETLCRTYWYPLYAYIRRLGRSPDDAQDFTQEFFAKLLQKDYLRLVAREKGKFRSFMLMALKRFLANEWDRAKALKRGGGLQACSLDFATAEARYAEGPANTASPDLEFEREWAFALLERVLARLREEYEQEGKPELFTALKGCLLGSSDMQPYADLARQLAMSEGAVKVAVHRLRQRYREHLRNEIANTVAAPEDVADEMHHLFRILARR